MNLGTAIIAALAASPVASAFGVFWAETSRFSDSYRWHLTNNELIRDRGLSVVDLSQFEFLLGRLPGLLLMLVVGVFVALLANLFIGVPVVILTEKLLGKARTMQLLLPTVIGLILGGYLWGELNAPFLPFDLWRNSPGLIAGSASGLMMAIITRRHAREWTFR